MKPLPSSSKGALETILVVDDNVRLLNLVVVILKRANFQVLSANDGPTAIEVAKKGKVESTCSFPMWTCP
jgi:CheY-like chemotaxis protein